MRTPDPQRCASTFLHAFLQIHSVWHSGKLAWFGKDRDRGWGKMGGSGVSVKQIDHVSPSAPKYPFELVFPFLTILFDFSWFFHRIYNLPQTLSSPPEYSNLFFFSGYACFGVSTISLSGLSCLFHTLAKRFSVSSFSLRIQRHRPFQISRPACSMHANVRSCAVMHAGARRCKNAEIQGPQTCPKKPALCGVGKRPRIGKWIQIGVRDAAACQVFPNWHVWISFELLLIKQVETKLIRNKSKINQK